MAMEESEETATYRYIILLLGLSSLALAAVAMYIMELLSLNAGAAAGAVYQSNADRTNVTPSLVQVVSQLSNISNAIHETYILAFIAFGLLGSSLVIYMTRSRKSGAMSRRYTLLHTTLSFIYAGLLYIILTSFPINYSGLYLYIAYAAVAATLAIDVYLEFIMRSPQPGVGMLGRGGMRIEPDTPYTNLVKLREGIFSKLNGDVRIIDKHFNSDAISNLHRLLEASLPNIKKIEVLTSSEMFDAKFNDNFTDFRNELRNSGVELSFMLMSEKDGIAQHERFIFDAEKAYKIPPLNIINKKSEHVVSIRVGEARSRFESLMRNATKYDNYVVKQARGPG